MAFSHSALADISRVVKVTHSSNVSQAVTVTCFCGRNLSSWSRMISMGLKWVGTWFWRYFEWCLLKGWNPDRELTSQSYFFSARLEFVARFSQSRMILWFNKRNVSYHTCLGFLGNIPIISSFLSNILIENIPIIFGFLGNILIIFDFLENIPIIFCLFWNIPIIFNFLGSIIVENIFVLSDYFGNIPVLSGYYGNIFDPFLLSPRP